ncbi:hypothetical protein JKP88DRAFT_290084 [Tribonema minus]|uniref:Uncharacterized protein n=1 Tax=Tribonema minus TaxID=303371 RepID=A0A835Z367_9STRA|nr:hypothetical protein JKP88DRAFT_290084 [Tribonema minus]
MDEGPQLHAAAAREAQDLQSAVASATEGITQDNNGGGAVAIAQQFLDAGAGEALMEALAASTASYAAASALSALAALAHHGGCAAQLLAAGAAEAIMAAIAIHCACEVVVKALQCDALGRCSLDLSLKALAALAAAAESHSRAVALSLVEAGASILEELRELLLAGKAAETKQLYRNALDCYVSASVLLPGDERLVNKVARLKELAGVDENCTPNADATAASEQQDGEEEDIAELLFSHNWCDGGDGNGGNAVHAASAAAVTSETAKFGGATVVEAGGTLDVQEIKMEIKSEVEMRLLDVVNNGDEAQLRQLWGIGPKRACLIMEARTTSPFRALEDLERIGMYRTQVIKATQALLSDDAC